MHARPHLTTHGRAKGHSALAGVAYRLGLRLFDKRTNQWHDFRRRVEGEEIVAALTIAPSNAPAWVEDPQVAWAAVEAAERRRDSQLAHDYRIPLPLGLSAAAAVDMARSMAQCIVSRLDTFVSIGVHRDSGMDAMGLPKPLDKRGHHAHLYFPTRKLAFESSAEGDEVGEGAGGTGSWGLGEKLRVLSHKVSAAACIEALNAEWAKLANTYAAAAGMVPDFTHLSYARLGLDKVPQLSMGAAASALERKGVATWKGDRLRALNPSQSGAPDAAIEEAVATPAQAAAAVRSNRAWLHPASPILMPRPTAALSGPNPSVPNPAPTSLAARFWSALVASPEMPQPTAEVRERVTTWLHRLERALHSLARLGQLLSELAERYRREDGARATYAVELGAQRAHRAQARAAVATWMHDHPWHLKLSRAMGGVTAKPGALVELEGTVLSHDTQVQQLKRGVHAAQVSLHDLDRQRSQLADEEVRAEKALHRAVESICYANALFFPTLLSVSAAEEVPRLVKVAESIERVTTSEQPVPVTPGLAMEVKTPTPRFA
ncbi:hypothetical protein ACVWWJ_003330 [Luteibacter sp. HA06]